MMRISLLLGVAGLVSACLGEPTDAVVGAVTPDDVGGGMDVSVPESTDVSLPDAVSVRPRAQCMPASMQDVMWFGVNQRDCDDQQCGTQVLLLRADGRYVRARQQPVPISVHWLCDYGSWWASCSRQGERPGRGLLTLRSCAGPETVLPFQDQGTLVVGGAVSNHLGPLDDAVIASMCGPVTQCSFR